MRGKIEVDKKNERERESESGNEIKKERKKEFIIGREKEGGGDE